MSLKSGIFSLLANCVLLGIRGGYVQVHHIRLKKYFSSSRQFLDKIFVKNNHHLDFMQGVISTSGVNTAFFFIPKSGKICKKSIFLVVMETDRLKKERGPFFLFK